MPSLNREDVRNLLPSSRFSDAQLDVGIEMVTGWVMEATGLPALPDPLPYELWAPATELMALLASNPESLARRMVGPTLRMWPLKPERDAILERLRMAWRGKPLGSFPAATTYPDQANAYAGTTLDEYARWVVR